jgi:hypothetical protein
MDQLRSVGQKFESQVRARPPRRQHYNPNHAEDDKHGPGNELLYDGVYGRESFWQPARGKSCAGDSRTGNGAALRRRLRCKCRVVLVDAEN